MGDRPSRDQSYLAILLPEQSNSPKLVWVKHEYIPADDDDSAWYKPDVSDLLSEVRPVEMKDCIILHRNVLRNFSLNDTVRVYFREAYLRDGSSSNQSLPAITKDQHFHDWRGPMVVIPSRGITLDPEGCKDATLADLRCAADYFTAYGAGEAEKGPHSQGYCVEGVRISCVGDMVTHGVPKFSALRVPMDHPMVRICAHVEPSHHRIHLFFALRVSMEHPMFGIQTSIPISKTLEMPLLAHQLRPDVAWKDYRTCSERFGHSSPYENIPTTFLHMKTDPDISWWGWAPMRWQNDVGSVIVVRQDRKPLVPKHIDALCDYCQFTLQPLFEVAVEGDRSKEDAMRSVTRAKFGEHFELYRKKMMDSCGSEQEKEGWKNIPSPF